MYAHKFNDSDARVNLTKISTLPPDGVERGEAEARFQELGQELFDLQELMFAAGTHSLLLVLQGRDAAGKDGTIKRVVGWLNPRGVDVTSFGVPSAEELDHDFLWRVHPHTPPRGGISIFNRSHYEDVLVVRVHKLAPPSVWRPRFEQINDFERLLVSHRTIVLKFFLHITAKEQEVRLLEREQEPEKAWKLNAKDWAERDFWPQYTRVYQDAIGRCASKKAPWYVVPADKKWFRNLAVAEAICAALKPHRGTWKRTLATEGKEGRAEVESFRRTRGNSTVEDGGQGPVDPKGGDTTNEEGAVMAKKKDDKKKDDKKKAKKKAKKKDDKKKAKKKTDKKKAKKKDDKKKAKKKTDKKKKK